jgi:hypothetical protein
MDEWFVGHQASSLNRTLGFHFDESIYDRFWIDCVEEVGAVRGLV